MNFKKCYFLALISLLLPAMSIAGNDSIITTCTRVAGGDMIIASGKGKVKLIGVDTPKLHESVDLDDDTQRKNENKDTIRILGMKSSYYTEKILEGKEIRLEFDPANTYINNKDKYGRLLAYVYVKIAKNSQQKLSPPPPGYWTIKEDKDGVWAFFNAVIISAGYARTDTKSQFKYLNDFKKYEKDARENNRGLWTEKDFQ